MFWEKVKREEVLIIAVLILAILVIVFAKITDYYLDNEYLSLIDIPVYKWILRIRTPLLNQLMTLVTLAGNWQMIMWGGLLCVILLAAANKWKYVLALLVSNGIAIMFSESVKAILVRPRPPIANALIETKGYSFPSGHSSFAVVFYGLIAYFWYKHFLKNNTLRMLTVTGGVVFVVLLGFSRIYLGVHWTTDVMAGFSSSGVWLLLTILYLEYRKKELGLRVGRFNIKDIHWGMLTAGVMWLSGLLLLYQQYV